MFLCKGNHADLKTALRSVLYDIAARVRRCGYPSRSASRASGGRSGRPREDIVQKNACCADMQKLHMQFLHAPPQRAAMAHGLLPDLLQAAGSAATAAVSLVPA